MDNTMNVTSSCLMLAANLITPVSLDSIFEAEDLQDTGVEFDSHVTVLWTEETLERENLLSDIQEVLSKSKNIPSGFDVPNFLKFQNKMNPKPVFDLFDLGTFENEDAGYVVLKLKKDSGLFQILETIHTGLLKKYELDSKWGKYVPHLTLAEVKPGEAKKYTSSETLNLVLQKSKVLFEDFIFSYDLGDKNYKVFDVTHFNSVDRYFRIENLKKESLI